ncbi:hypothetical protein Ciccas_010199 [Cichlidogyrus casuarinus]|uniref:Uncharacterized protein n=1 Tax=Cichlidogyrus casuarinus TaxID=1844966 RepID=A0ABD2PVX6_9PLAT
MKIILTSSNRLNGPSIRFLRLKADGSQFFVISSHNELVLMNSLLDDSPDNEVFLRLPNGSIRGCTYWTSSGKNYAIILLKAKKFVLKISTVTMPIESIHLIRGRDYFEDILFLKSNSGQHKILPLYSQAKNTFYSIVDVQESVPQYLPMRLNFPDKVIELDFQYEDDVTYLGVLRADGTTYHLYEFSQHEDPIAVYHLPPNTRKRVIHEQFIYLLFQNSLVLAFKTLCAAKNSKLEQFPVLREWKLRSDARDFHILTGSDGQMNTTRLETAKSEPFQVMRLFELDHLPKRVEETFNRFGLTSRLMQSDDSNNILFDNLIPVTKPVTIPIILILLDHGLLIINSWYDICSTID